MSVQPPTPPPVDIPTCPTYIRPVAITSGRNSVVECQLPKLDVVGSNPIARFLIHYSPLTYSPFGSYISTEHR
jgi:hypothetical protein